jgi:hypothetical protein
MAWLFERMIELAAWVALILGIAFFCEAVYALYQWVLVFRAPDEAPGQQWLLQSTRAAGAFVASALAVGALASIDRYVFDFPQQRANK